MTEEVVEYAVDSRQRISLRNQINNAIRNWQKAESLWHEETTRHDITKEKLLATRIYGAVVTLMLLAQSINIVWNQGN